METPEKYLNKPAFLSISIPLDEEMFFDPFMPSNAIKNLSPDTKTFFYQFKCYIVLGLNYGLWIESFARFQDINEEKSIYLYIPENYIRSVAIFPEGKEHNLNQFLQQIGFDIQEKKGNHQ